MQQDVAHDSGYVSTEIYSRLLKAILRRSADESFAFLPHGLRPGTFALLCQAMLAAPDLGSALRTAQRFFRVTTQDFAIKLIKTSQELRFELHLLEELSGPESFFTEAAFAVFLRLNSWLIDRTIVPSSLGFRYAPEQSGRAFESKYACPIHFHQSHSYLSIPFEYIEEPIKRNADQLQRILKISLQSLLLDFKKNESLQSRVSAYFMQKPQHLSHGLEEIAAHLSLNPATLRRRLRDEGHNVNELRENVRRQRSLYFLACTHKSVDAIALELGYSEASTFHRAFKKWTGATPQRYRQKDRELSCQSN